jgi:hypothetical protein
MSSVIEELLKKIKEKEVLQAKLPNLKEGTYKRTSDPTGKYNCIAHAAYDCTLNWWPLVGGFEEKDRYWPKGAPQRRTINAFKKAFELQGFELCENGELDANYEKVVLYVSDKPTAKHPLNAPTHMARQLPCGNWTSKLGPFIDIMHDKPERLIGSEYGRIELFLRRSTRLLAIRRDDETGEKTSITPE